MSNIKINDVPQRIQYAASTGQTQFSIPYPFFQNNYVYVWQDGVQLQMGGAPGQYSITGAGSPSGGQITLVTPALEDSIITIEGEMPIDRTSIYSATISNLTGSDLNGDFNREVVMLQQLNTVQEFLQLKYAPWALVSQDLEVTRDRFIPILLPNQVWAMNGDGTEIVGYNVPAGGGIAPSDAKYLLQQADSELPNAQAMGALATGLVVNTITTGVQLTRVMAAVANQLVVTNPSGLGGNPTYGFANNAIFPGTEGTGLIEGTTAERPGAPTDTNFRFNTDINFLEYWDGADWVQISETDGVTTAVGTQNQVLVNDTFGVPEEGQIILTLPQDIAPISTPTFNNIFLDGGLIKGTNNNTALALVDVVSAVNWVQITNSATANSVIIGSSGSDSAVSMEYLPKGSGVHSFYSLTNTPVNFRSGTAFQHTTAFQFSNTAQTRIVTFQDSDGTVAFTSDLAGYVTSVSGTANRITSTGGTTPAIDISASYVGQASITTLGAIETGTWQGTVVGATYGGTGVNNGANTLTLDGTLATSGAFASVFTMTGETNVTFPTSGTLATTAGASGIVNSGLINQLTWYAANGTTVSGFATANNGLLVTSSSGVPSIGNSVSAGFSFGDPASGLQVLSISGLNTGVDPTNSAGFSGSLVLRNASNTNGNFTSIYNSNFFSQITSSINFINDNAGNNQGSMSFYTRPSLGAMTLALTLSSSQVATFSQNVVINGVTAGRGAANVASNTAFGSSALAANQAGGTLNSAFGNNALSSNTTGDNNTAVGYAALSSCQADSASTAMGYLCLSSQNGGGGANTGYGFNCFGSVTLGTGNVGYGYGAGIAGASGAVALTTGTDNTFLGILASSDAADSIGTLAIGRNAVATKATGATSADNGSGVAIGSASFPVGFRGDGTIYPTAGASAGYWRVKVNGTQYKIQLFADS